MGKWVESMPFASRICIAAFLVVLLSFMTAKVSAGTWLIYDDGEANFGLMNVYPQHLGVYFSLPSGERHWILTISYYIYARSTPFRAHIYSSDGQTDLFALDVTPIGTEYWINIDVSAQNIIIRGYGSTPAFFVTVEYLTDNGPEIGLDTGLLYRHSIAGTPGYWTDISELGNVMIRAETQKTGLGQRPPSDTPSNPSRPVGGELYTANKIVVLLLYPVLIGLIGVVSTVYILRRKGKTRLMSLFLWLVGKIKCVR